MDTRNQLHEVAFKEFNTLRLFEERNAHDEFVQLALSSETDEIVYKKIKNLINQGYDINSPKLICDPSSGIYVCAPAIAYIGLTVHPLNHSPYNRLLIHGASINYLAYGYAIAGHYTFTEHLRTKYLANPYMIYIGYTLHVGTRRKNNSSSHLPFSLDNKNNLDFIENLINYYETELLDPKEAQLRKTLTSFKLGVWENSVPTSHTDQEIKKLNKNKIEQIFSSIESAMLQLALYGQFDARKECILSALKNFTDLQMAVNHLLLKTPLKDAMHPMLSETKIALLTCIKVLQDNIHPSIPLLLQHPKTAAQGYALYKEKESVLTPNELIPLLFLICNELAESNRTTLLNHFFQNILSQHKLNVTHKEHLQNLISILVAAGNLNFAIKIINKYPFVIQDKFLGRPDPYRNTLALNSGQAALEPNNFQKIIFHGKIFKNLVSFNQALEEEHIKCYFEGAFKRLPNIQLTLQNLKLFNHGTKNYDIIFIKELLDKLFFSTTHSTICFSLKLRENAAILTLAQFNEHLLYSARKYFRNKELDFHIINKAIHLKNLMKHFQLDPEEANYLNKIIQHFKAAQKTMRDNIIKEQDSKDEKAKKNKNLEKDSVCIQSLVHMRSAIYFIMVFSSPHAFNLPSEILFKIFDYIFPAPASSNPHLIKENVIHKFALSKNRHLIFHVENQPEPKNTSPSHSSSLAYH